MKPASYWKDEFCNKHIINVRGSEVEAFIKQVQADARRVEEKEVEPNMWGVDVG